MAIVEELLLVESRWVLLHLLVLVVVGRFVLGQLLLHCRLVLVLGLIMLLLVLVIDWNDSGYFSILFWLVCGTHWERLWLLINRWCNCVLNTCALLDSVELGSCHHSVFLSSWRVQHSLWVFIVFHLASLVIVLPHRHWHIFGCCIIRVILVELVPIDLMGIWFVVNHRLAHLLLEELEVGFLGGDCIPHLINVLSNYIEVYLLVLPVLL